MEGKKRQSYTVDFKRKVIKYAETHGNRAGGRKFDLDESVVRRWKANKDLMSKLPGQRKAMRGGKAHWPELEQDLKEFVLSKAGEQGVDTALIRARAKEMAQERGITNFFGGSAWCDRFLKRHGLCVGQQSMAGLQLPEDEEDKTVKSSDSTKRNSKRPRHKTVNMDEVPRTSSAPMSHTVTQKGTPTVQIAPTVQVSPAGLGQTQFSITITCTAGNKNLKPMVVVTQNPIPKETPPSNVAVVSSKKATPVHSKKHRKK